MTNNAESRREDEVSGGAASAKTPVKKAVAAAGVAVAGTLLVVYVAVTILIFLVSLGFFYGIVGALGNPGGGVLSMFAIIGASGIATGFWRFATGRKA